MYKATKGVLELDKKPHQSEASLLAVFGDADSEVGEAVKSARTAGLPWATIIALMIEFGPKFAALIQAILAGLNTNKAEMERLSEMDKAAASKTEVDRLAEMSK